MDIRQVQATDTSTRAVSLATPNATHAIAFDLAIASDIGNERESNEDAFGFWIESEARVVFAVADGVGGYEGGEVASRMAIDVTLEAYRNAPAAWGAAKRLSRAAQRANIEIYDRAVVVTELRRMATTLTAVSINEGSLHAAHIGDCRLYLLRGGEIRQLSKDHTVNAVRSKLTVLAMEALRQHPERGALTRCLGSELIAAVDRISTPLEQGDVLLIASDGLHTTLDDSELRVVLSDRSATDACQTLLEIANRRGTHDNLTAAVYRQTGPVTAPRRTRLRVRLEALLRAAFRRE